MYDLIIVDDEENVREILKKNINQSQTGFRVVGTAEDGEEALKLVKERKPNVVITDICMPGLSGLDLIKEIQKFVPDIKTVVISGYDEFSYAKTAMTLGVTEYLLKPFLLDELYQVLNKIKDELEHQASLVKNITEMQNQIERNLLYSQEHFLKKIIEGNMKEEDVLEEGKQVRIQLTANLYCVGIFKIFVNTGSAAREENADRIVADLFGIVNEKYFDPEIKSYALLPDKNQLVMIFCGSCRNQIQFYQQIEKGIEKMNDSMERYYHTKMKGVLGNTYADWNRISSSYKEALSVWKGVLNVSDHVMRYDEYKRSKEAAGVDIKQKPEDLELDLILQIQMSHQEKALEILREILMHYASYGVEEAEFVNVSLVELVFRISESIVKAGGNLKVWEDENVLKYLKRHFTYGTLMEAKTVLEQYVKKCCEEFSIVNEKQSEKIVFNLKMLIENNLSNEEFNIEEASAQMYFSHNYVRRVFKNKTGESFADYLYRRRMETAGELLMKTKFKVHEIARKTGYSNQRYFASCFKRFYGCTPTEYRE